MDARQELFAYLGAAITTIAVLFGAQHWYASYLDVSVVHGLEVDAPMNEKLAAVRAQEQQKLSSGRMPIDRAMQALAQRGRMAFPLVAPKPSEDLSPMSGWIHQPGFTAYVPRKQPAPAPAAPTAAPQAQAIAAGAEAGAPAPGAPAPAATKPVVAKPVPPKAALAAPAATPKPAPAVRPVAPQPTGAPHPTAPAKASGAVPAHEAPR